MNFQLYLKVTAIIIVMLLYYYMQLQKYLKNNLFLFKYFKVPSTIDD